MMLGTFKLVRDHDPSLGEFFNFNFTLKRRLVSEMAAAREFLYQTTKDSRAERMFDRQESFDRQKIVGISSTAYSRFHSVFTNMTCTI